MMAWAVCVAHPILSLYHIAHGQWHGLVLLHRLALQRYLACGQQGMRCTVAHCSCMFARLTGIKCVVYQHVLQSHDGPDVWHLGNMCVALGTCEPSCTGRPTSLFFMFEARGPQETAGRVVAWSPPCREAGSRAIGHAVHRSLPSVSRATVHVVAPEPFLSGR
jgi:hypothetical protein